MLGYLGFVISHLTIFFSHFLLCVKLKGQSTELCLRLATNLFNFDTQPFANLSFRTRKLCVVRCFRLVFVLFFVAVIVVCLLLFLCFGRGDFFVVVAGCINNSHMPHLLSAHNSKKGAVFDYFSIYQVDPDSILQSSHNALG